jgi:hypothetical protein
MNLRDYRDQVAAALETIGDDWAVHHGPEDALQPPAFMLREGPDPWLTQAGACFDTAALEVIAIAPRFDVRETADMLDDMVSAAAGALSDAGFRPYEWTAPAAFEVGGIVYVAAVARINQPVKIGD